MKSEKAFDKVTAAVSLGKTAVVRGYTIRRLPLGRYLEMTEMLRDMPERVIQACFPGQSAMQVLGQLKRIDAVMLSDILMRVMTAAPAEAVRLLAYCTGIEEKVLLEDEIGDIANFFAEYEDGYGITFVMDIPYAWD